jgi:hypothetical protein
MSEIEVYLVVRKADEDGYTEYQLEQPLPWTLLSSAIKRIIRKLLLGIEK